MTADISIVTVFAVAVIVIAFTIVKDKLNNQIKNELQDLKKTLEDKDETANVLKCLFVVPKTIAECRENNNDLKNAIFYIAFERDRGKSRSLILEAMESKIQENYDLIKTMFDSIQLKNKKV